MRWKRCRTKTTYLIQSYSSAIPLASVYVSAIVLRLNDTSPPPLLSPSALATSKMEIVLSNHFELSSMSANLGMLRRDRRRLGTNTAVKPRRSPLS